MRVVSRLGIVVLIFAALLVAAEPTYHHHPLAGGAGSDVATSYCAICAVGGSQTVLSRPVVIAPAVVAYLLVAAPLTPCSSAARAPLAARGPPAL